MHEESGILWLALLSLPPSLHYFVGLPHWKEGEKKSWKTFPNPTFGSGFVWRDVIWRLLETVFFSRCLEFFCSSVSRGSRGMGWRMLTGNTCFSVTARFDQSENGYFKFHCLLWFAYGFGWNASGSNSELYVNPEVKRTQAVLACPRKWEAWWITRVWNVLVNGELEHFHFIHATMPSVLTSMCAALPQDREWTLATRFLRISSSPYSSSHLPSALITKQEIHSYICTYILYISSQLRQLTWSSRRSR